MKEICINSEYTLPRTLPVPENPGVHYLGGPGLSYFLGPELSISVESESGLIHNMVTDRTRLIEETIKDSAGDELFKYDCRSGPGFPKIDKKLFTENIKNRYAEVLEESLSGSGYINSERPRDNLGSLMFGQFSPVSEILGMSETIPDIKNLSSIRILALDQYSFPDAFERPLGITDIKIGKITRSVLGCPEISIHLDKYNSYYYDGESHKYFSLVHDFGKTDIPRLIGFIVMSSQILSDNGNPSIVYVSRKSTYLKRLADHQISDLAKLLDWTFTGTKSKIIIC